MEDPQLPQDDTRVPESPRAPRPPTTEIPLNLPETVPEYATEFVMNDHDFDYSLESIRNFPPIIINIPGNVLCVTNIDICRTKGNRIFSKFFC
jgi:hypothetical protein